MKSMYRSSPLRSTLNTNVITGSGMCKVCTGTRGKGVVTGSPTYLYNTRMKGIFEPWTEFGCFFFEATDDFSCMKFEQHSISI